MRPVGHVVSVDDGPNVAPVAKILPPSINKLQS